MATSKSPLTLLIAAPRGFCAGVDRAITIVELALERYGAPVYVRHEIVHNKFVVDSLKAKGAIFVAELDQVPDGVPVVFSAHGVPKAVPAKAEERGLNYLDATCPLVSKVHRQGPRGEDICYATSNRQQAVKDIAHRCDAVLVIGAPNSSNSVRLVEVAEREGTRARLVGRASDIDIDWLEGVRTLGITAGASAPEILVREVVDRLSEHFDVREDEMEGVQERMVFKLPRGLEAAA